jgi:hypothetical protein
VKETWASVWFSEDFETGYADDWDNVKPTPKSVEEAKAKRGWPLMYKADGHWDEDVEERGFRWLTPIFMPRWASRITLEVAGIRVERLQDIDMTDVEDEGVDVVSKLPLFVKPGKAEDIAKFVAHNEFKKLWDSINGKKHPWESNPWVWVVEFELFSGPDKQGSQ